MDDITILTKELTLGDHFLFLLCLDRKASQELLNQIEYTPICLSFEEVTTRAVQKVLVVVGNSVLMIVDDPQGILDQ